jgi:hypothetical protein
MGKQERRICACALSAQETTASLRRAVFNPSGARLPSATRVKGVILKSFADPWILRPRETCPPRSGLGAATALLLVARFLVGQ